ncbi:hypothetical protein ACVWYH_003103 [Bradyrhizobium sp. GM24.11]
MRSLFFASALSAAFLVTAVHAQAPQEIVATDTIDLRSDSTKTFTFDQPVARFSLSVDGVAEITPDTDRVFTVKGLKPGKTLMTAYGPDGTVVHRSNISVEQTQGFVRIFGQKKGGEGDAGGFYRLFLHQHGMQPRRSRQDSRTGVCDDFRDEEQSRRRLFDHYSRIPLI